MKLRLYSLFAVLALLCGQSMPAFSQTTSTAATAKQLAALQPPPTGSGNDRFAMDVNCNLWSADQTALNECSKDLDLIAG
ncbi:hypothetical protein HDG32_007398, partial [Paraburkholderia sp. CI2]|nr:hypothetical protein [Paraburkholderia sp. CI2]